jgi:hypothetical protein
MNRITPRWLYLGMAASLAAVAIAHFLFHSASAEWISLGSKETAYFLATAFCLEIAAEYRRQPMLRLAWLLLAANGLISMARHVLEMGMSDQFPHMHLYRQIAITLALLFLLGGMLTMARAFLRTGLGFRIHRIDAVAVAMIFGIVSLILIFHDHLSEARVPMLATRDLQLFSQIVIAVAGATSVVLHRIILDMGGGKLAIAMRFLVGHILGRVVLVLTGQILQPYVIVHPQWGFISRLCFDATSWIFALAACYRAQMFAAALRQAPPKPEEILALSLEERWARFERA